MVCVFVYMIRDLCDFLCGWHVAHTRLPLCRVVLSPTGADRRHIRPDVVRVCAHVGVYMFM